MRKCLCLFDKLLLPRDGLRDDVTYVIFMHETKLYFQNYLQASAYLDFDKRNNTCKSFSLLVFTG